jgi:hypothetical protein
MAPAITLQAKRNQISVIAKLPNKTDFYWQRKESIYINVVLFFFFSACKLITSIEYALISFS